jgi:amino acid transporter
LPTLTPALVVTAVAGMAGTASWLIYVFATFALLIVGINIGRLTKRIPSAGSFIYVSRSLGPSYGLYPVPASPYSLFPYFFLVYILLGVSWFFISEGARPTGHPRHRARSGGRGHDSSRVAEQATAAAV